MRITVFLGDPCCLQPRNDGYIIHIGQDQKRIGSTNHYILLHFVKFLYIFTCAQKKKRGKLCLIPDLGDM